MPCNNGDISSSFIRKTTKDVLSAAEEELTGPAFTEYETHIAKPFELMT
jgi:hypothetical protein